MAPMRWLISIALVTACIATDARAYIVSGNLKSTDPLQAGRLIRTGVASSCGTDKQCPGVFNDAERHFETFFTANTTTTPYCVFIHSSSPRVFLSIYASSFDPNNLCANYLGDIGSSSNSDMTLVVPGRTRVVLNVTEIDPNALGDFLFSVFDDIALCPRGTMRGDFDNRCSGGDVIVRNANGSTIAFGRDSSVSIANLARIPSAYDLGGTGYFSSGNGGHDIAWHNRDNGQNAVWRIADVRSRPTVIDLPAISDTNFEMVGSEDFDHNGTTDLIFRNKVTGANAIWLLTATSTALTISGVVDLPGLPDANWEIRGAGDVNNDMNSDIVWRNRVDGQVAAWLMNGTTLTSIMDLPAVTDTNWVIQGVADFDSDLYSDLFWFNASTGAAAWWSLAGGVVTVNSLPTIPAGNAIVGPR